LETTGKQHHPQLDYSNPIPSSELDIIYVDDDVDELIMVDASPTFSTSTQFHVQCKLCGLRLLTCEFLEGAVSGGISLHFKCNTFF
jgi:hypothetical protein